MLHQKLKKIILTLGIFAIAALTYAADKVELFVTPNPVQVGVPGAADDPFQRRRSE